MNVKEWLDEQQRNLDEIKDEMKDRLDDAIEDVLEPVDSFWDLIKIHPVQFLIAGCAGLVVGFALGALFFV